MSNYDLWVHREPRISKQEWREVVASRADLSWPSDAFGDLPEGAASKENLTEFVWWTRDLELPTRVAFVAGAIHIEAANTAAFDLATEIAAELGGEVSC